MLDMVGLPRPKLTEETMRSLEISTGKSFEQLVSEPFRVPIPNKGVLDKSKSGNEVARMLCGVKGKIKNAIDKILKR